MAGELVQNEQGQFFVKLPGNRHIPVQTQEEAKTLLETPMEAFAKGAANSMAQLGAGMGALAGVEGARDDFGRLQQEQQQRTTGQPVGAVGAIAPDVLMGLATGSAGLGARTVLGTGARIAGAEAALGGGLGAARNPDNPLAGAATGAAVSGILGGTLGIAGAAGMRYVLPKASKAIVDGVETGQTIGQRIVGRSRVAGQRRSVGAAANADPSDYIPTTRPMEGRLTPQEADDLGISLTRGERAALGARTTDDLARADRLRDFEDIASSTTLGPVGAKGEDFLPAAVAKSDQKQFFSNHVAAKLGAPNVETLTPAQRGNIRKEVQDVFQEHIDKAAAKVGGIELAADEVADIANLADNAGMGSQTQLTRYAENIEKAAAKGKIPAMEMTSLRNKLTRDIESAYRASNPELAAGLSAVQDTIDDAIQRVARKVNPESAEAIKEARTRWGILKALEAPNAVDASGKINLRAFSNAYKRKHPSYKSGVAHAKGDEFARVMDTLDYLTSRQTNDSGTARRLANAGGAVAGTAALGGVGAGMYGLLE